MSGAALSREARNGLGKLKSDNRTIIWLWGAGSVLNEEFTEKGIRELTQLDIRMNPEQEFPHLTEKGFIPGKIVLGFEPLEIEKRFESWRSIYFGTADVQPENFRKILKESGVFLYTQSNDVISVSKSALMLLGTSAGVKNITLPEPKTVWDMRKKKIIGINTDNISVELTPGEPLLLELR